MAFENSPVFLMPSLAGLAATNSPMLFPLAGGRGAVISPLLANIYLHYFGLASPLGEKRSPQDRSKAIRVA